MLMLLSWPARKSYILFSWNKWIFMKKSETADFQSLCFLNTLLFLIGITEYKNRLSVETFSFPSWLWYIFWDKVYHPKWLNLRMKATLVSLCRNMLCHSCFLLKKQLSMKMFTTTTTFIIDHVWEFVLTRLSFTHYTLLRNKILLSMTMKSPSNQ